MPRNGQGAYSRPPGTTAVANTVIASATFNGAIDDIASDLNAPRPISMGGTGATSKAAAQTALGVVPQDDTSDATAGRLLLVGGFGQGGVAIPVSGGDCNLVTVTGVYRGDASATLNMPTSGHAYTIVHYQRTAAPNPSSVQYAVRSDGLTYRRTQNFADAWGSWLQVDAITASGSNSNGSYVKHESGLMECTFAMDFTAAISTAYLGGYRSATQTWTFPSAFSSAPRVWGAVRLFTAAGVVGASADTTTTQGFFAVTAFASQSSDTRSVNLYARGPA